MKLSNLSTFQMRLAYGVFLSAIRANWSNAVSPTMACASAPHSFQSPFWQLLQFLDESRIRRQLPAILEITGHLWRGPHRPLSTPPTLTTGSNILLDQ